MAVNWSLAGGGNNALAMFGVGAQMGQQIRQRQEERQRDEALATYAANPDAPEAVNALLKVDPRLALQVRGQQQQQIAQEQEQRRADLPLMEKLLGFAQDEATYQQALGVARQYGIETDALPQTFDPAWRDQQLAVVKLLNSPQGQEAASNAGKQAMDAGFQPGTPEFTDAVRRIISASMAQPFTGTQGETRLYTPDVFGGGRQVQGGPAPGAIEDGHVFKGGNPADPNAWEPVSQGGPTPQASAGFRP